MIEATDLVAHASAELVRPGAGHVHHDGLAARTQVTVRSEGGPSRWRPEGGADEGAERNVARPGASRRYPGRSFGRTGLVHLDSDLEHELRCGACARTRSRRRGSAGVHSRGHARVASVSRMPTDSHRRDSRLCRHDPVTSPPRLFRVARNELPRSGRRRLKAKDPRLRPMRDRDRALSEGAQPRSRIV